MVGRYGLALLITLGAVVLGLELAAALWWTFFGGDDVRAEEAQIGRAHV